MNIHQLVHDSMSILVAAINKIGYLGIFIGMFLESTIVPIPSELVMIPAGLAAANGDMSLFLVTLYGVLGNVLGAIFSFYIALYFGRAILFKVGRYFLIKPDNIMKIEHFFGKHGEISVFIGRLIPGFRHFISLPAGVARMNIAKFTLYTTLGSAIWTSVLAILGYLVGKNQHLIQQYLSTIITSCVAFAILAIAIYILIARKRSRTNFQD